MYSQIIKRNRNINDNNIFLKNYKFKINLLISTKLIILYKIIKQLSFIYKNEGWMTEL